MPQTWDIAGLDSETWLIDRALLAPPLVCLQDAPLRAPGRVTLARHARPIIEKYLESQTILVLHNAAFDIGVFIAEWPDLAQPLLAKYERGQIHCTVVRQKLLDLALGLIKDDAHNMNKYSLEAVAGKYGLAKDGADPWRIRYAELYDTPVELWPPAAVEYAAHDPEAARDVWLAQQECCDAWAQRYGSPILHETGPQSESAFDLHLGSAWGCRTHEQRTELLLVKTRAQLAEWRQELIAAGYLRILTPTGRKCALQRAPPDVRETLTEPQLTQYLTIEEQAKWLLPSGEEVKDKDIKVKRLWTVTESAPEVRKLTKKGEAVAKARAVQLGMRKPKREQLWSVLSPEEQLEYLCTDADACELAQDPILIRLCEFGSGGNMLSGVEDLAQGYHLPLQADFDVLKATGRTSSSKPRMKTLKGKQLQNFPQSGGLRECIVPRAGNGFIQGDFPGAELNTHAQNQLELFGRSRLAEALNAGIDPHLSLAARLLEIPYEDAITRRKQGDPEVCSGRDRAKPPNFGFPGGMGEEKFVLYSRAQWGVVFSLPQAAQIKDAWLQEYPENAPYFKWVDQEMRRTFGAIRQFQSLRWRGGGTFTAYCNGFFQGRCADGAKAALRVVTRETFDPASPLFGFHLINFVHDEFIFEGPLERCSVAALRMTDIMRTEFNRYVPDVPIKRVDPVVMLTWSKKAKSLRAPDGSILPWDLEAA